MAARGKRGRSSRGRSSRSTKGRTGKRFADLPNSIKMRRRSPDSAPRLYEWLVDNGYVETVPTHRRKSANRRARGR
jgi:hypothetical protein